MDLCRSPAQKLDSGAPTRDQMSSSGTGSNALSPGRATSPSGNSSSVETPARMFGDTLHLHRSSANAKQVEACAL